MKKVANPKIVLFLLFFISFIPSSPLFSTNQPTSFRPYWPLCTTFICVLHLHNTELASSKAVDSSFTIRVHFLSQAEQMHKMTSIFLKMIEVVIAPVVVPVCIVFT